MEDKTVLVVASVWAANLVTVALLKRPKVRNSRKGAELIKNLNSLFVSLITLTGLLIAFLKK